MARPRSLQEPRPISVRMPEALHAALRAKAHAAGLTPSVLLRRIVDAYCRGEEKVTIIQHRIVVRRGGGRGRLVRARSWAASERALLELADEAYALAQALLAAEQPGAAAAYYRSVAQLLRLWMTAHRDRDLAALQQRLARVEAQHRRLGALAEEEGA